MLGQRRGKEISQELIPVLNGLWTCLPPISALISEVYIPFTFLLWIWQLLIDLTLLNFPIRCGLKKPQMAKQYMSYYSM